MSGPAAAAPELGALKFAVTLLLANEAATFNLLNGAAFPARGAAAAPAAVSGRRTRPTVVSSPGRSAGAAASPAVVTATIAIAAPALASPVAGLAALEALVPVAAALTTTLAGGSACMVMVEYLRTAYTITL